MFIRKTTTKNKKTGKEYVKHSLVESVRTEKGPRQRTIMQLGKLSLPRSKWPLLVGELERRLSGEQELPLEDLEPERKIMDIADEAMHNYSIRQKRKVRHISREKKADYKKIDLNTVTTSYSRTLGAELVVDKIWNDLNFPEILSKAGLSIRERSLAEAVVAGRLISPGSEKATWEWMRDRSAICELTEKVLPKPGRNSLYDTADALLGHRDFIEDELMCREKELYPGRESICLFDITNFYMEGQAVENILAARGKSKQKRNDCPLISLGMVVDPAGFPLASKVYEGNIGEPKTLKDILSDLEILDDQAVRQPFAPPVIVMDRGIATKDNVKMLRKNGIPYIIIERGARNRNHLDTFENYKNDPDFELIERENNPRKVWVKRTEKDDETVEVLCVSEKKRMKEKGISERWRERAAEDILRLQNSVRKGYVKDPEKIQTRIGRLYERYSNFGRHFDVKTVLSEDGKKGVDIEYTKKAFVSSGEDNPLWGTYVIETPLKDKSGPEIWHLYMTLTRVEDAFRYLKSDLGTRPVFHQYAARCRSHIFISILAYHILISIEYQLSLQDDYRSWKTIRKCLETHRRTTAVLIDGEKQIHEIRHNGQPESIHRDIYDKLGIEFRPQRTDKVVARRV